MKGNIRNSIITSEHFCKSLGNRLYNNDIILISNSLDSNIFFFNSVVHVFFILKQRILFFFYLLIILNDYMAYDQ